ncbi:MAG: hypothetical protein M3094_08940, partial [Actinomycetia bacterium]|nr:hypothetical protein [Actinomycetes bacterium]
MNPARALSAIAAFLLLVTACTNLPAPNETRDASTTTTTRQGEARAPLLVLLDQDRAVVVVDQKGDVLERYDPPPDVRYAQPIWGSPDTIVSARIAIDDIQLIATRLGGDLEWSVQFPTTRFYYLPRPGGETTTVATLRVDDGDGGLIAEVVAGSDSVNTVSSGSPFYVSWDPVGDRLATHVGGNRLDIFDDGSETISAAADGYQAPVWLEQGLATLRTTAGETYLSLW